MKKSNVAIAMEENKMKKAMSFKEVFGRGYISWPKVGESVEIKVDTMTRIIGDEARSYGNGGFDITLSGVDYGVVLYDAEGKDLPIRSWEVYHAISAIGEKLQVSDDGKGLHLKIHHIKQGNKKSTEQLYDVFTKVNGSWKRLDKNKEWSD